MKEIVIPLIVVLLVFSVAGCNQKSTDKDIVMESEGFINDELITEGLTLLERTYDDTDQDGVDESIELYTSVKSHQTARWDGTQVIDGSYS